MTALMRVALAGAGMVSTHHLAAWARCAGAQVVAIADPDINRARERAATFGIPAAFADVAEMLDAMQPDALDIATPVSTHVGLIRLATRQGRAVLCQKPLALNLGEMLRLAAELNSTDRVMVHENWRFRTPYRQARAWINEGRIGAVRRFDIAATSSGLLAPPGGGPLPALVRQPFLAELDRLVVFELLIHHLDLARALCGELQVAAARADQRSGHGRGELRAAILLDGNEVFGTIAGDFAVAGSLPTITDRVEFIGASGAVFFDGTLLRLICSDGTAEEVRFETREVVQSGYDSAIDHFRAAVMTGHPFETSIQDNLRTVELVEAVYSALVVS